MLVDSKKQTLKDEAVLMVAAQETKSKHPAATVFAALVEEMNSYGTTTYRAGNTIFVMHHAKDRIGFFRALNADTARNYLENCYEWVQAAYKMGFDTMVTDFQDPTIINIFKAISRRPPQEGMGYRAEKTKSGYRVFLKLGPKREGKK
jgi:hypothetical protein